MLLEGKVAVVYGGGGSVGGAVARAFARQGATVEVVGHLREPLQAVAREIEASGGRAATAEVDALDADAVEAHAADLAARAGSIDVSLNVISQGDVQGTPLIEMDPADFMRPVEQTVLTNYLTATAAARRMVETGGGTLLFFGGYGEPTPNLGGLQVSFGGVEALRRSLAAELGPRGVRAITLKTGGIPESIGDPDFRARIEKALTERTMLGRVATLADVGNAAVLAASDLARTVTATELNITCGAEVD
jgi:3-oxoacyl-[acyl-carrier protein] reductase